MKKYVKSSTVNNAAALGSKETVNPKVWLPELGLTMEDKKTIRGNSKLDDKVINAAQTACLKEAIPRHLWLARLPRKPNLIFEPIPVNFVQIHHDPKRDHCVCSSSDGNIHVFDSLFKTLSGSMQIQLAECYRFTIKFDTLEIEVPRIQWESGGIDCGLFAVAFAYELAAARIRVQQTKQAVPTVSNARSFDQMP